MTAQGRLFLRKLSAFAAVGFLLYVGLYAATEVLVSRYGRSNRFLQAGARTTSDYDAVILGASHAGVFDYRDLNQKITEATGARVINLSVVGGGPVVNQLLFDYFLTRHRARTVLYFVDSFAFYKPDWNERRLDDARLFQRAPFDPRLVPLLARAGASWKVTLDYAAGFSKINNADRFSPDVREEEGARFERAYRPVAQIDEQRLAYLYPATIDAAAVANRDRYLGVLAEVCDEALARGMRVVVVKPPVPARVRRVLPGEADFDAALEGMLRARGLHVVDLSAADDDEKHYYDTDHLNLTGASQFIAREFPGLLRPTD